MSVLERAICSAIQQLGALATVSAVRQLVVLQYPADTAAVDAILLKRVLMQHVPALATLSMPVQRRRKRVNRRRASRRASKRKRSRKRVPSRR